MCCGGSEGQARRARRAGAEAGVGAACRRSYRAPRPVGPQCRGGRCSPRKRELDGATPSHWLRGRQITRSRTAASAARQRRRGGRARRPPRQGHPRPASRQPAGPSGRTREGPPPEAARRPSARLERSMPRKGNCWPTRPRPTGFFSLFPVSYSCSLQSILSLEARIISQKGKPDESSKTQSPTGAQGSA